MDHRATDEMAKAVGAAETAARAAEFSRVEQLAAAKVAPQPRSQGGGRAGCSRATSITPKQICQWCGERCYYITKCKKTENAVMAIDLLGRSSTDDDSPVCCEADVEGYITLEMKTGECLGSLMRRGK